MVGPTLRIFMALSLTPSTHWVTLVISSTPGPLLGSSTELQVCLALPEVPQAHSALLGVAPVGQENNISEVEMQVEILPRKITLISFISVSGFLHCVFPWQIAILLIVGIIQYLFILHCNYPD